LRIPEFFRQLFGCRPISLPEYSELKKNIQIHSPKYLVYVHSVTVFFHIHPDGQNCGHKLSTMEAFS
jgi:hypothetical protein